MRVLQIGKYYHPAKGGIETHLRLLSSGLLKFSTVRVAVAAQGRSRIDLVDGIEIERLALFATILGAPICPGLIARLRKTDSDVVHIHLPNPWAAVAYLASQCRLPLVVTYHSDIVRQTKAEHAFRPILLKFLERSSAIICSSPNLIQHSRTLQRFRDRCAVIPFGVDLERTNRPETSEVDAIRDKYKKPIVLSVGRLVYYKGFEHLIRAMTQINGSLIIIGNGPLKSDLFRLASNVGVSDRVTILDQVADVTPFYHAAELFVLPSIARSEAFGIVQLEAMAAGKPVVNTALESGVPFVSQHGITGLTVPPAQERPLAEAINRILSDPDLHSRYGSAGRLRVQQEFTVGQMVKRTLTIYHDALAAPQKIGQHLAAKAAGAHR